MKKTPLKRKTPLKAKSGFKHNTSPNQKKGVVVESLGSYTILSSSKTFNTLKKSKLRLVGVSDTAILKSEIQALLRAIVILRDGGCFLRHFKMAIEPQYAQCGGVRKDGNYILQAEHLHSRSNANSFSDTRLVVCVCKRHHIFYKPQFSAEYNELAGKFIGSSRKQLWDFIKQDRSSHKIDLRLAKIALEQELKQLLKKSALQFSSDVQPQNNIGNVISEIYEQYDYLLK